MSMKCESKVVSVLLTGEALARCEAVAKLHQLTLACLMLELVLHEGTLLDVGREAGAISEAKKLLADNVASAPVRAIAKALLAGQRWQSEEEEKQFRELVDEFHRIHLVPFEEHCHRFEPSTLARALSHGHSRTAHWSAAPPGELP